MFEDSMTWKTLWKTIKHAVWLYFHPIEHFKEVRKEFGKEDPKP